MAKENPPTAPAAIAHRMLVRFGNTPCSVNAIEVISAKAHACENAVKTNALARREPYPPAKSEAPHMKTAATEYAADGSCDREDTPDEVNMGGVCGKSSLREKNGRAGDEALVERHGRLRHKAFSLATRQASYARPDSRGRLSPHGPANAC